MPIIIYSHQHSEYVSSFLEQSVIFKSAAKLNKDNFDRPNMIISFLDSSGLIIYSDIADKYNYDKSRYFYKKLNRFEKNKF